MTCARRRLTRDRYRVTRDSMGRPPLFDVALTHAQRQARYRRKHKRRRRALSPASNPPAHDMVQTPPKLARAIVAHFAPTGACLDPCRGSGAFWRALRTAPGVTSVQWCEITQGRDFFDFDEQFDWIITNPPWSRMRALLKHGMKIADHLVYLSVLAHFQTSARLQDIRESGFGIREALLLPHPPKSWPRSGFQLACVHIAKGWKGGMVFSELETTPTHR
jgi:hypothetical protein